MAAVFESCRGEFMRTSCDVSRDSKIFHAHPRIFQVGEYDSNSVSHLINLGTEFAMLLATPIFGG